jgi:hypothetical protein
LNNQNRTEQRKNKAEQREQGRAERTRPSRENKAEQREQGRAERTRPSRENKADQTLKDPPSNYG